MVADPSQVTADRREADVHTTNTPCLRKYQCTTGSIPVPRTTIIAGQSMFSGLAMSRVKLELAFVRLNHRPIESRDLPSRRRQPRHHAPSRAVAAHAASLRSTEPAPHAHAARSCPAAGPG